MTGKAVAIASGMRDRKMQRALMQFFKPVHGARGVDRSEAGGPDRRVRWADTGAAAQGGDGDATSEGY